MSAIGPGDLVVCVDDALKECDTLRHHGTPVKKGRVYRVAEYAAACDFSGSITCECPAVSLVSVGTIGGILASRFRKLNDGPDDAELIERIRKCKPMKAPGERIDA